MTGSEPGLDTQLRNAGGVPEVLGALVEPPPVRLRAQVETVREPPDSVDLRAGVRAVRACPGRGCRGSIHAVNADDATLIEAWRAGDVRAADTLLRRYFDLLWRFFRNKVDDAAEEMIQRTMTALLKTPEQFRGEASFRTYLFSIARSELFRFYKERQRDEQRFDFDDVSVADMGASPSSVAARRQHERALLIALRRIPLEFQILLEWHYWEDMTMVEIAAALDIPLGTAKSRLRRARARLQDTLRETIESRDLLQSTLQNLDGWAKQLRDTVARPSET